VRFEIFDTATALFASPHAICARVGSDIVCTQTDARFHSMTGCADGETCAALSGAVAFSISDENTCTVSAAQVVQCSGDNSFGVVNPDVLSEGDLAFLDVGPGSRVAVGSQYACAIGVGDALECWGRDIEFSTGRSGGDSQLNSCETTALCQAVLTVPTPQPFTLFQAVAAKNDGACALEAEGHVVCWGDQVDIENGAPAIEIPLAP
jgi:hypothetical protein